MPSSQAQGSSAETMLTNEKNGLVLQAKDIDLQVMQKVLFKKFNLIRAKNRLEPADYTDANVSKIGFGKIVEASIIDGGRIGIACKAEFLTGYLEYLSDTGKIGEIPEALDNFGANLLAMGKWGRPDSYEPLYEKALGRGDFEGAYMLAGKIASEPNRIFHDRSIPKGDPNWRDRANVALDKGCEQILARARNEPITDSLKDQMYKWLERQNLRANYTGNNGFSQNGIELLKEFAKTGHPSLDNLYNKAGIPRQVYA